MHNLGTGPAELACFAADLWNDRIFLNDKAYLTGQLSTAALNWDNDGFAPKDEKGRTCRQVAAATGRDEKERAEDHLVKVICACRLNTIAKHLRSGKITDELAAAAKRLACERRDRALFEHDYAVGQYESDMSQDAIYSAAKQELSINS